MKEVSMFLFRITFASMVRFNSGNPIQVSAFAALGRFQFPRFWN